MCGRFIVISAPESMRELFGYVEEAEFPPRYNIAPTQPIAVIHKDARARHFSLMRWGFLPSWVRDPRDFPLLINARVETVEEKPAFRNAIRRRRALVPADGYYEWQATGRGKRPHLIRRRDGQPFGLAAIFETWMGPNGEEVDTAAILTAAATGDIAELHDRVPLTIAVADFSRWLDCTADSVEAVAELLAGSAMEAFTWHPVSRRVNHAGNEGAQLALALTPEEIEAEDAEAVKPKRPPKKSAVPGQQG
ncbi:MAG: SOS response-associated peptidase [Alphaproteobacteria bacterium]|nr:SOS response-associated peptidase [Alphaproteobacteria bacterium]